VVNWLYESLFPRCTATSAAGHRPGKEPGRGRKDVCHFHRYHQALSQRAPREAGPGLDAKKKTLVASEQKEAERAAWRTPAADLPSQDLVEVSETGSHFAMTPLYASAPRGERAGGFVPRN
jgi:hypothetical protein